MKESDYIAAQNLWRVRLAAEMVSGTLFHSQARKTLQGKIYDLLYDLETELGDELGDLR